MNTYFNFLYLFLIMIIFSCTEDEMPHITEVGEMEEIEEIEEMEPDPIEDTIYFPPLDQSVWNTQNPEDLDWDEGKLTELIEFVEDSNSKSFLILHNGRMVVEEYFDDHNQNANWTWFSAAKSLTSVGVGIAQAEGFLDLEDKTSDYLGDNWSFADQEKQDLIKVRNHVTMTTGFDNNIVNFLQWTCTAPLCMQYETDAGTRWSYHQGAFTLTQDIISQATGMDFKEYLRDRVQNKIGINGFWTNILDVRIFNSNSRGMARFGLLALNEGNWDGEQIYPAEYHQQMTNTSQEMNKAYGYLWWLNGKQDFLTTLDQTLHQGSLVPNAPADMYAALGANDQKIYVVPSLDMVVVRTGDAAGAEEFASSSFDNHLWEKINEVLP